MKKNFKNGMTLSILAFSVLSLASCGDDTAAKKYTYRDYLPASPETWNVHNWSTNSDSLIMGYSEIGLYDFAMNSSGDGYEIVPEMASGDPVTAELTDAEKQKYYDATTDEKKAALAGKGYKWTISLNQNAKWEDGTIINADTYVESMELMLNSKYKNLRASTYTSGTAQLAHASDYNKNGESIYEDPSKTAVDSNFYFNLYEKLPQFSYNYSMDDLFSGYLSAASAPKLAAAFADEATWGNKQVSKYVVINASNAAAIVDYLNEVASLFGGFPTISTALTPTTDLSGEAVVDWGFVKTGTYSAEFKDVGIKKESDYSFSLYLAAPISKNFNFYYSVGASNWIVKKDIYVSNTTTTGGLSKTTYGTTKDAYMSYGPYKLTDYQLDKTIKLDRNENWYGWTDGKHKDQYQTTDIEVKIIADENAALLAFENGEIDSIGLRPADLSKYGKSSNLLYTPQSYTTKMSLNSNYAALKARQDQSKKENKTILANRDFREALSWSINRTDLAQTQTAGSQGYLVPINDSYIADSDTGLRYRNTEEGKRVITNVFGTNASGYDHDKVVSLVKKAVDTEIASKSDGHYREGDKVVLLWSVYNDGWKTMIDWLIEKIQSAMVGTALEGKLEIKTEYDLQYADKMQAGKTDICMSTWGGATFDPYGIPEVYCDASYKYEFGFNPLDENTAFAVEGIENGDKHTFQWWYDALNKSTGAYNASSATTAVRIKILAAWEENYIKTFNVISLYARRSVSIESFKVKQGTEDYNELYGYGGVRFMTYNYTDSEWATRVSSGLDYTI